MRRTILGQTVRAVRRSFNRAGLGKRKVFAVGLNKTGTLSLHALFESLGLLSYHGTDWTQGDNLKLLRSYDCFSDGTVTDVAKLDRMFPGSKFILQVRELDGWVFSRLGHHKRMEEEGGRPSWDASEASVKAWIRQRNDHHLSVLTYFADRPSDFLLVNFIRDDAAATKVARFLGYEGSHQKPHGNANPRKGYSKDHTDLLSRCARDLGIPEAELRNDILCPSLLSPELRGRFPADTLMIEAAK